MGIKFIKSYLFATMLYIAYAFCFDSAHLNLVAPRMNDTIKVLAEGTSYLSHNSFNLIFKQIPQEDLFLEIRYLNPSTIESPYLSLNNNLVRRSRFRKEKVAQIDYFHIDYFHIPANFINFDDNNLLFEFKNQFPSEISIKLVNFLYKLPSNNLVILYSHKKEQVKYLSAGSYFRIPIFLLIILSINAMFCKIRKTKFKQSFFSMNIILFGLSAMFATMLLTNQLAHLTIKITLAYFIKIIIFYFYIIALFNLFCALNTNSQIKLLFKNVSSLDFVRVIAKNKLLFYFFVILMLSFGLSLVELATISRMVSTIGDIIIIIISVRFLNSSLKYLKEESIYNVSSR